MSSVSFTAEIISPEKRQVGNLSQLPVGTTTEDFRRLRRKNVLQYFDEKKI